ncbi:MAG TPA: hypothetical protein P5250_01785 [Bacteroidales bacterium]|nr:hypothetical protein [Bacteroidales bacterium]
MIKHLLIIFIILIPTHLTSFCQDKILLINGKILTTNKIYNIDNKSIAFKKNKKSLFAKDTIKKIPTYSVFSIKYSSEEEKIIYQTDSTKGFILNTADMRAFIYGEQYARIKIKANTATIIGFISGAIGGYYQFWGTPLPVVTSLLIGIRSPKCPKTCNSCDFEDYLNNKYFIAGYQDYGSKKKISNSVKGGIVGFLTTSLIISYISNHNWK